VENQFLKGEKMIQAKIKILIKLKQIGQILATRRTGCQLASLFL